MSLRRILRQGLRSAFHETATDGLRSFLPSYHLTTTTRSFRPPRPFLASISHRPLMTLFPSEKTLVSVMMNYRMYMTEEEELVEDEVEVEELEEELEDDIMQQEEEVQEEEDGLEELEELDDDGEQQLEEDDEGLENEEEKDDEVVSEEDVEEEEDEEEPYYRHQRSLVQASMRQFFGYYFVIGGVLSLVIVVLTFRWINKIMEVEKKRGVKKGELQEIQMQVLKQLSSLLEVAEELVGDIKQKKQKKKK